MGGAARRRAVGQRRRLALGLSGAVGLLGVLREKGSALRGAAERAKAVGPACQLGRVAAIRALWARPVHALGVLDEMPEHATELG